MVVVLQSTDPADLPDGYDVPDFLDVPVRDDAEVAARLAFENYDDGDAFTEIETARQGSVNERDGKMSREDIAAVLDNPDRFSPEAVALATYLDQNPDTRRHLDVASEGRFLDGLDEGEFEPLGDGDGKISRADVTQYQLNVATFEALNNARERGVLGPPERDGQYTTKQLQELRDSLPEPSGNGPSNRDEYLAVVIDQTIENNWLDSRDKKAKAWDSIQTLNSIGNPVSIVLGRPQHLDDPDFDPSDPLQDYKEFGKGLGDFGVSVYDLAAASPIGAVGTFESARANLFEEMGWEGSTDRGQQMREGLSEMPDAFATLIPGTDAWDEAMEAKRRSGTWNSHQGYAMGKNIVDVEAFLNDPARWAGSIAPEVVLSIVTGGTAATVTRGTKLGSKIISAARFATKHGAKQAARQGLKLTVDTFQTGAQKSRVFITDTGEVITRSGQNLAQTYKETRLNTFDRFLPPRRRDGAPTKPGNPSPGQISFMATNDGFYQNASRRRYIDPDGFYDVVAHGDTHRIQIHTHNGPVLVDHRIAARLISQQTSYSGQKIRLFSCSTGACSDGFAQNLANKLNVEVQAPSDLLWAYPDGQMLVAAKKGRHPDGGRIGEIRSFFPMNQKPLGD